ncbi:conserved hypothetical protein [Ricinus communis]|uniref:Uncharacterized protein n=1 Tax=Ricinus communis TaxID=3988 RepID=B9RGN5_RICCO|nr:conserved hypothetical protein [Ricinus communis]
MAVGSNRQSGLQQRPPPMQAGLQWATESGDIFLKLSHQFQPGRTCTRKVAG